MKALSLQLLQGTINEVEKTVTISYVQPKTLDRYVTFLFQMGFSSSKLLGMKWNSCIIV
jgi:hypothetical protein